MKLMKTRYFKKHEKTFFMNFCFVTRNQFLSSQIIFPMNKIYRSWRDLFKNVFRMFFWLLYPSWISILQIIRFDCIFNIFWNICFSSILLFFNDFCYFFCNNSLFSWLFRNLEQLFRHLVFISGFGCFTWISAQTRH